MQAVRKRPGMYVGGTDESGVQHLVTELISNSIDQFLAGKATQVSVGFDGDVIEVSDDGPGLPPYDSSSDSIEGWFRNLHTTASATDHAPHIHLALLGTGLFTAAALCERLEVESVCAGRCTQLLFSRGELVEKRILSQAGPSGCRYRLTIDRSLMRASLPNQSVLRGLLFQAAHLFPGIVVNYSGERFHSADGVGDLIYLLVHPTTPQLWARPSRFLHHGQAGKSRLSVAAIGDASGQPTNWMSWANGVATASHGDHVGGLQDALEQSGWKPAAAMIHVIMDDPRYAGPVKDQLIVPEIRNKITSSLLPELNSYLQANPSKTL